MYAKSNLKSAVKMTEVPREGAVFGVRDATTQFLVARVRGHCTHPGWQHAQALGSRPATPSPM